MSPSDAQPDRSADPDHLDQREDPADLARQMRAATTTLRGRLISAWGAGSAEANSLRPDR